MYPCFYTLEYYIKICILVLYTYILSKKNAGYAPLSVRLIEKMSKNSYRSLLPLLKDFPASSGPHFEYTQGDNTNNQNAKMQIKVGGKANLTQHGHYSHSHGPGRRSSSIATNRKVVMVLFLGGCTATEVSALRFLANKSQTHEYIVMTTGMITGEQLLMSCMDDIRTSLRRFEEGDGGMQAQHQLFNAYKSYPPPSASNTPA